jgi:hypothetical protein
MEHCTVPYLKITVNWLVWQKNAGAGFRGLAMDARVSAKKPW